MICVNQQVMEQYMRGESLNDAIDIVHGEEIKDRIKENAAFAKMTPLQMVMYDADIKRTSSLDKMFKHNSPQNAAYTSGGLDTNQWLFPAWVETTLRETIYEKSLLPYICTTTIPIDGNTIQSPTLNMLSEKNKKGITLARVAEAADIPTGKITIGSRAITLWKHARAIELTYETLRRMRINIFTRQMQAIASDLAGQNLNSAIDVTTNGDGNDGSTPISLGTTSTAAAITRGDIIDGLLAYSDANKINANVAIVPKSYLKEISQLTFDTQLAPGASNSITFNIPQISAQNVTFIGSDLAKVNNKEAMILLNSDMTLIRYEENGSNIQEMDRYIRNQTSLMTFSENSGYAINLAGSNMYMEIKTA